MIGEPVGIRTRDLLIKRQLLHFEIKDAGDHHNQRTPTAPNTMPPKKIVLPHIPLDFPGTASIAVRVDGPSWVAARLAPSAGLAVVQASRQARCDPEGRQPWPTGKPPSKQRAASRPVPARSTSRLARASAKRDGVICGRGRAPWRRRPMRQQGFGKQVPSAALGQETLLKRSITRVHAPNRY